MKLDGSRSKVSIYTFAEGLFSALAHDLELAAEECSGDAEGDRCEVRFVVRGIRVQGVMKRGKLDRGVLSASDRETIERQIREDVMRGGAEISARGAREADGKRARIEIAAPTGKAEASCPIEVRAEDGATRARGEVELSLRALGVAPVKGPMGAFRVSDKVRITFDLAFV